MMDVHISRPLPYRNQIHDEFHIFVTQTVTCISHEHVNVCQINYTCVLEKIK